MNKQLIRKIYFVLYDIVVVLYFTLNMIHYTKIKYSSHSFIILILLLFFPYLKNIKDILQNKIIASLIILFLFFLSIKMYPVDMIKKFYYILPIIFFYCYIYENRLRALRNITIAILFITIVISLSSILFFKLDPNAPIILVATKYYKPILCGTLYGFYMYTSLLSVFLIQNIQNIKKFNAYKKIFYFLLILTSLLSVYYVRSSLQIIITFIFSIIALLLNKQCKSHKFKIFISIIFIFIFSLIIIYIIDKKYLSTFILNLSNIFGSGKLNLRLKEVSRIISDPYKALETSDRILRSFNSIKIFLNNPIIGAEHLLYTNSLKMTVFQFQQSIGLGLHSELFDNLALYGIIGNIPFLSLFIIEYLFIVKHTKSIPIWIFGLLGTFITNNAFYMDIYLATFFILPSLMIMFKIINVQDLKEYMKIKIPTYKIKYKLKEKK